jgi:hypothetical protein
MIKTIILSSILTAALGATAAFAQESTRTINVFGQTFEVANAVQPQISALAASSPMQTKIIHMHKAAHSADRM